jgi:hypothetical protein
MTTKPKKAPKWPAGEAPHTAVIGNTFIGVNFDAKAAEAVTIIARALLTNADALLSLARVLNASNVTVGPLLSFSDSGDTATGSALMDPTA